MNARSERVLQHVSPDLAAMVRNAADTLAAEVTYLLVVSGLRTAAEQYALTRRAAPRHAML